MNELGHPQRSKEADEELEIDLLDLLGYFLTKLPWLVAALVAGGLLAGLYTYFMIPNRYTATSRMYMVSASSDSVLNLSDLNLGTSISNDYVELMKSRPVVEEVIEDLGLAYNYNTVLDMISLSVVNNTRIVRISATSTDPQEAMDIANHLAMVSKEQLPKIMEAPSPTIAEYAILPQTKSGPSLQRNTAIGGIAGLVIILGILTVLYLMDDTVKSSEDVEKLFGVMPLSEIPEDEIFFGDSRNEKKTPPGGSRSRDKNERKTAGGEA